tara:strand:+ start:68 stop:274 length:207 start_codon:yes stop_codon:yes gene_type:complete
VIVTLFVCAAAICLVIVLNAVMLREGTAYTYNVKLIVFAVALIEIVVKSLESCIGELTTSVVVAKGAL